MKLNIQDTFNKELPADPNRENTRRQVFKAAFSYVTPRIPGKPKLVHVSKEVLQLISLREEDGKAEDLPIFCVIS